MPLGVGMFVISVKGVLGCEEVVGWEGVVFFESRGILFDSFEDIDFDLRISCLLNLACREL